MLEFSLGAIVGGILMIIILLILESNNIERQLKELNKNLERIYKNTKDGE